MLTVRLGKNTESRLENLAKKTGRTKSYYVRLAIENNIDYLEEVFLAKQVLENIKLGKEKTHPLNEVRKQLDLDN